MSWSFPPYLPLPLAGAGLALALAVLARRRRVPGTGWFALLMLALAEWDALWALESAAVGMPAKLFWSTLQYVGISAAPPLFLLFALTYAARGYAPPRRAVATLWIIPAITLGLALANGRHGLIWSHIAPSSPAPTAPLIYTHGS